MPATSPHTVLIVEDEMLIRLSAAEDLRDCGYRVLEASTAAEAIAILQVEQVDLVFTDVNMPGGMDGVALAAWMRTNVPDVRILMTSGVPRMVSKVAELCTYGHFLQKPYPAEALTARIEALLTSSQRPQPSGRASSC